MNGASQCIIGIYTYLPLFPLLTPHFDRLPIRSDMATLALITICAIVFVVLVMASDACRSENHLLLDRYVVASGTLDILVLPIQLEVGLVVIEIPILPVAGVMTLLTALPQRLLVCILLFMARPAVRLGLLEYHSDMAFLALDQDVLSRKREGRYTVIELHFRP